MLEMKCILAKIVMSYELLPTEHTPDITAELILRPVGGIYVKLQPRNKK
jgi:hypothetical protein